MKRKENFAILLIEWMDAFMNGIPMPKVHFMMPSKVIMMGMVMLPEFQIIKGPIL